MNKIVFLLLTILFGLSIMGCASAQDRAKWHDEQFSSEKMKRTGGEELWYPSGAPGMNP